MRAFFIAFEMIGEKIYEKPERYARRLSLCLQDVSGNHNSGVAA
jgi:hypothetical protein